MIGENIVIKTLDELAFHEGEVKRLESLIRAIKRAHKPCEAFRLCLNPKKDLLRNKHLIQDFKANKTNYALSVRVNELSEKKSIKLERLAKAMLMTKQQLRQSILFGNNPQRLEQEIEARVKKISLKRGAIKNV